MGVPVSHVIMLMIGSVCLGALIALVYVYREDD